MSRYVLVVTWASLALLVFALPADAQTQHLIPLPFPLADGSARVHGATSSKAHQHLVPLPYPRALGPNALGNLTGPATTR
jgi:hypothetical protein